MKFLIALSMLTSVAFAGENDKLHLPKSFPLYESKAVFADFSTADYHIDYDVAGKSSSVSAEIALETFEDGHVIFDSYEVPASVKIDGQDVSSQEIRTPGNETTIRIVNKVVKAGKHTLAVKVPLTTLVEFTSTGVKSAFWTSDLSDRKYLERYMPANFEFDQVKMTFHLNFAGAANQTIYTNGVVTQESEAKYKISYPAYFTSSSIFFHTVPAGSMSEARFTLKSVDGREIPVVVYTSKSSFGSSVARLKTSTTQIFHELEGDYGAFPHPSITVYQAGMGGMEYCGATMTDFSALGHELFHSYFARGVMPANGNAGWIDEAFASWRDDGYQTLATLNGSSNMSSHPYYTRTTDTDAYSFGENFMRLMDGKTKDKGGLKPFMRYMVDQKTFKPFFIEEFIREISTFYGKNFEADFKRYTFDHKSVSDEKSEHKVHRKMSIEELQNHL